MLNNFTMRYFIAQDLYSNWYCLPENLRETWTRLINKPDAYNYDGWSTIEEYKIDISNLTFENPKIT